MKHVFFTLVLLLFINISLAQERPNILVFLCDDLGYGDLGCYGHPMIQSPNLDRLVEEGVTFTNAYNRGGCQDVRAPGRIIQVISAAILRRTIEQTRSRR